MWDGVGCIPYGKGWDGTGLQAGLVIILSAAKHSKRSRFSSALKDVCNSALFSVFTCFQCLPGGPSNVLGSIISFLS
jgi:hypothetical protein